jgi:methylmalonyl-CoA/ethylmalonyl-CoA epimerase
LGEGFEMIHQIAKAGADNKMIAFAHPKSTNGVLTEVCSDNEQAS